MPILSGALLIALVYGLGLWQRLPIYLSTTFEGNGTPTPAWIVRWRRWNQTEPIERAFASINWSLSLLGRPQPAASTPAERARILSELLPTVSEHIWSLEHELELGLYMQGVPDLARARRAALLILIRSIALADPDRLLGAVHGRRCILPSQRLITTGKAKMPSQDPSPVTLHGQARSLAAQTVQLRDALQKLKPRDLPADAIQNLGTLADMLGELSRNMESVEAEHGKLLALTDIGGVVNSSLELDEVLGIVMDNIVRLTGAERGFLMLRDEKGEMVTRVARHWSQEAIKIRRGRDQPHHRSARDRIW